MDEQLLTIAEQLTMIVNILTEESKLLHEIAMYLQMKEDLQSANCVELLAQLQEKTTTALVVLAQQAEENARKKKGNIL